MSLVTLGLSGALGHDAAAAIFIDDQLVAAAEEERLLRIKHAEGKMPYKAARFCLNFANVKPREVDIVAIPFAPISLFSKARWHYAKRYWYAPDRSLDGLLNGNRRYRRHVREIRNLLDRLEISWKEIKFVPVEHQLAHASSCYHLSGFEGKTAILGVDIKGEYATTFLGYGENGKIHKIKEFYDPDSLCGMYAALTDYLGFEMPEGEFKVMGIAPSGDPDKYDLSRLVEFTGSNFKINTHLINTIGLRRFKHRSKGHYFSQKLVDWLGPRRAGNLVDDPYVHYAASIQKLFEDIALGLTTHYLSPFLRETGKLVIAGSGALNVKLNQRLLSLPNVKELFVHPACNDAGTAIGAASYAVSSTGITVKKLTDLYLGQQYTNDQCIEACRNHREKPLWEKLDDTASKVAELITIGEPIAWFQGRMEFGPRGLGNRSILGDPCQADIVEKINKQIKYREKWRPFSPSILDSQAEEILGTSHPAPYMAITFHIEQKWKELFPSVVYEDGTVRPQIVSKQSNSKFHALLEATKKLTGLGVLLNTSLNRPGEAMVSSPKDALELFFGSDLKVLIMEDILVTKPGIYLMEKTRL